MKSSYSVHLASSPGLVSLSLVGRFGARIGDEVAELVDLLIKDRPGHSLILNMRDPDLSGREELLRLHSAVQARVGDKVAVRVRCGALDQPVFSAPVPKAGETQRSMFRAGGS